MKLHHVLASLLVVAVVAQVSWSETFQPTTGTPAWNLPSNWSPATVPNSSTAAATINPTTGPLTIDLVDPNITVNSLTFTKTASTSNVTLGVGTNTFTLTNNGATLPILTNGASGGTVSQTIIAAPVVLGADLEVRQNDRNLLQFAQGISGTGGLTIGRTDNSNNNFSVALSGNDGYSGATKIINTQNGSGNLRYLLVRLDNVTSIPGGIDATGGTSNLSFTGTLNGSAVTSSGNIVLGLSASDFRRGIGAGLDKMTALTNTGSFGWAAFGQDRIVRMDTGLANFRLIWGGSGINANFLVLGHPDADKTIDLQNSLDLTTGTNSTVTRNIRIEDGPATIDAIISAPIVHTGTNSTGTLVLQGGAVNGGTVKLTAANLYTGTTTIQNSTVAVMDNAAALPSGQLVLDSNGVLGLGTGNDSFIRPLATTGNDTMRFIAGGGFAAFGANKVVNLGGSGAPVTWDVAPFITTNGSLTLGTASSDFTVDFQNPINLGASAGIDRTVLAGSGSAAIDGVISSVISGAGNLRKNQPGTLEISNANTYTGTTLINAGTLLLTNATSIPGGITGGNTNGIVFTNNVENPVPVLGLGQGDFTSELSSTVGAGRINLNGGTGTTTAGFAAYGAPRIVNFKASNVTQQVVWGTGGFVVGIFGLGASGADNTVDFQNPVDLAGGARKVKVANGTAEIDGIMSGVISDSLTNASLTKDGSGTLSITGNNTYGGGTTIIQGRLNVNNATGSGVGTGDVSVTNGTLGGSGFIGTNADASNVSISSGAHLAPGNSAGKLTVFGGVSLPTGALLDIELGGLVAGTDHDQLDVNGTITLGDTITPSGTLTVTKINSFEPQAGNSFDILNGTLSGTFAAVNLPTLTAGLQWDQSQLYSNGVLSVVSVAIAGDWNGDTKVNAADYVTWRKDETGFGGAEGANPSGYVTWRENFSQTSGAASGLSSQAVPEPATFLLLLVVIPLVAARREHRIRR